MKPFTDISQDLRNSFPHITSIYLSASYAFGEQTDLSDVDLFIFFDDITRELEKNIKTFSNNYEKDFEICLDITLCHKDYLTYELPITHSGYPVKRLLFYSRKLIWGENYEQLITSGFDLKANTIQTAYSILRDFLSSENLRKERGIDFKYIKRAIRVSMGISALEGKLIGDDFFYSIQRGLNTHINQPWKKYASQATNELHSNFFTPKGPIFNKKMLALHRSSILKVVKEIHDNIASISELYISHIEKLAKGAKPIIVSPLIYRTYQEVPYLSNKTCIKQNNEYIIYDKEIFKERIYKELGQYILS